MNPPTTTDRKSIPFDLVHTDLAGPFSVQSLGGKLYYMTLIDDATRYAHIYFLREKSEAVKYLKEFCELIHTRTGRYPRIIRSDRGGKYVNNKWIEYCTSNGIEHQVTPAYNPQSNGAAKRFNLIITNMS